MTVNEIINTIEKWAPPKYQEKYDNSGLQCGDPNQKVKGVIICLDCTEDVVNEAIEKNCQLIIAHHPIIFGGIQNITPHSYVGRTLLNAIKNEISIYACHTNLDNVSTGVNAEIGKRIGLKNCKTLLGKKRLLSKLIVYTPHDYTEKVLNALFEAGAGEISNYKECSFSQDGIGSFKPQEGSNAFVGEIGERHLEKEKKLEVLVQNPDLNKAIHNMLKAHPYEEVAYDLIPLSNTHPKVGSGMIGEIEAINTLDFFDQIKTIFNCSLIRHSSLCKKQIKRVAVCGGSGSFLLQQAIQNKADIFITSDFKYHEFFNAENNIIIADIGHYESEQFTKELIYSYLSQNFPTFALHLSEINTNPIKYY